MSKSVIIISLIVFFGIFGAAFFVVTPKANPVFDVFAKCLTDKKVVMYGAYWCSHCKNQKRLFGTSFQYVNYVECTLESKTCRDKGVKGYPTWIFEDGSRIEGEASLKQLSEKTSCSIP